MALIEANHLTITLPLASDDPPSEALARRSIARWLADAYGYPPPVEGIEPLGWSAEWEVGGRPAPGWRFDAVIPRHLGPSRESVSEVPAGSAPGAAS